jgi:hypothetical protein
MQRGGNEGRSSGLNTNGWSEISKSRKLSLLQPPLPLVRNNVGMDIRLKRKLQGSLHL